MEDEVVVVMDQQPLDDELPVALEVGPDGEDDNIVDAHLLQHRHVQLQGTSFVYGMVQDAFVCSSVLGSQSRSCRRIVERINAHNDDVYYQDPRTGRTPLHEACLRCSCLHVISAILDVNSARATHIDNAGNTPLHLLCVGVSTHAMDPAQMGQIVDKLLAENSSGAAMCNREGNSALHMACMAPETMFHADSFVKLLKANRASATRVNSLNQTPLSLHCQRRQASKEVAKLLLEAFPDAIQILDGAKGWSPLHYAAENANNELIRLLLQCNLAAASLRTTSNLETPLHLLCKKNVNERHVPAVQCLLQADPRSAMARDAVKSLTPLHLVCRNPRVPLNVVASIVEACPQAVSIPDNNNYLPMHHASEVGTSTEVIEHLLKVHPNGALATTKKKDSALSLACACNKSAATVALLIQANPGALTEKNHYGFVPLHSVCGAVQPKIGIVEEILRACPSCVALPSHGGESAVHIASGNPGTCVGVIELLTVQYEKNSGVGKAAVTQAKNPQMTNKVGNTPLHHACFRGSPFEHIETLAMSNPQWVKCANNAGYTALQIMCKNARLQDRVITTFSRIGGPGVFSVVDLMGNTPLHSAMREETDIEALRCLIRAYPDALNMKTSYGDTPLHLACFRRVDAEVVREVALASSEPPLLTPNTAGQTPIGIAMEEFEAVCKRNCNCCIKSDYRPEQQRAFDVLAALVKILHYGSSPSDDRDRTGSLLRACVSLHRRDVRLDPAFIRRALHQNPEEARVVDDEGNYPLHIEASIPVEKMSLLNSTAEASCSGNCHKRLGILRMLYEIFPDACKARNNAGEFPLGLMIKARGKWDQTFALILRKFPQALHWSVGVNNKVFPRILEKVGAECGVATLHQLITSRPDIAMRGASDEELANSQQINL